MPVVLIVSIVLVGIGAAFRIVSGTEINVIALATLAGLLTGAIACFREAFRGTGMLAPSFRAVLLGAGTLFLLAVAVGVGVR